jgi:hypothetical protein
MAEFDGKGKIEEQLPAPSRQRIGLNLSQSRFQGECIPQMLHNAARDAHYIEARFGLFRGGAADVIARRPAQSVDLVGIHSTFRRAPFP